jgi:hypothetical protein
MTSYHSVRGMAFVEAAMWLSVTVPVAFLGAGLIGMVNDQNLLQRVPASVLREIDAPPARWSLGSGAFNKVTFDAPRLAQAVESAVSAAFQEASAGVLRAERVSARGCYWIFSVNTRTGSLETPISTECRSLGPLGGAISLSDPLQREIQEGRGRVLGSLDGGGAYVDRVALLGVGSVGSFPGVFTYDQPVRIEWSDVAYPRQEVGL